MRLQKNRRGLLIPILQKSLEQETVMMNEAYFVKNLNNQKDVEAIRKTCI